MKKPFSIALLPSDIGAEIRKDYPHDHEEVIRTMESFIREHDYLSHERIVRCMLYLAKADKQPIKWALEVGAGDPRDVMLLAEYVGLKSGETPRQVRDFNKPFGQNELR